MAKTTGLASISEGKSEVHMIDPRKIKVRPNWNFRNFSNPENAEHVEGLYNSIVEIGVKEPLTVSFDKGICWLDNGECRLRAALLVVERTGKEIRVPVRAEDRYASPVDKLINQRVRNSGKPYDIFEDAAFFKHLLDMGATQNEIAKKCGMSAARISQILEHNTVGKVGRDMVANGQASASMVMAVTKEEGTEAEKVLLQGLKAAKKDGAAKIKPEHVGKVTLKKAITDFFDYADIDDSAEDMVVVKVPIEKWDVVKDLLKL